MKTKAFLLLILILLLTLRAGSAIAQQCVLQISARQPQDEKSAKPGQPVIKYSIEAAVTLGKDFHMRTVSGGVEMILWGRTKGPDKGSDQIAVEYNFRRADFNEHEKPALVLEGKTILTISTPFRMDSVATEKGALPSKPQEHYMKAEWYRGSFGFFFKIDDWTVKVVDEDGKSVADARGGLYDDRWNCMIGIKAAAADGELYWPSQRACLPLYTFVAEHQERGLFATANLNRDEVGKPFVVILRKGMKKPEGYEDDSLFSKRATKDLKEYGQPPAPPPR